MKKIKRLLILLFSAGLLLAFFYIIKEHFYHTTYSIGLTNSRSVAYALNKLSNDNEISFDKETMIEGSCSKDTIVITRINGMDYDKSYSGVVTEMGAHLYWKAILTQNEIVVWSCSKDILDDSKCKAYEYGDQNNIEAVFQKEYIGYYCMDLGIGEEPYGIVASKYKSYNGSYVKAQRQKWGDM